MTMYKLAVSFDTDVGAPRIWVIDGESEDPGPVDSCVVGEGLDRGELYDAWLRFHGHTGDSE